MLEMQTATGVPPTSTLASPGKRVLNSPPMPASPNWNHLCQLALDEVEATLAELPAPLRAEARKLPITFERQPSAALIADGIAPDTLGLFNGPEYAEEDHVPMPPQIVLFLENLWDFAERDEEIFLAEVNTTLLHELGHYLGLDEDELTERELD